MEVILDCHRWPRVGLFEAYSRATFLNPYFLGKSLQGKNMFVLAKRNLTTGGHAVLVDMEYAISYRLPTLSVGAAVRLAHTPGSEIKESE